MIIIETNKQTYFTVVLEQSDCDNKIMELLQENTYTTAAQHAANNTL